VVLAIARPGGGPRADGSGQGGAYGAPVRRGLLGFEAPPPLKPGEKGRCRAPASPTRFGLIPCA
jgi:hypothetical protein